MEFTHTTRDTIDGLADIFQTPDITLQLTNAAQGRNLVLDDGDGKMWFFARGWSKNWLTDTADFHEELREEHDEDYMLCSVTRHDGQVTFADADSYEDSSMEISIPACLVQPLTLAMMKRGLVLPLVEQNDHQDTLADSLLRRR